MTAQRIAIMQVVSARPHATADELAEDVRAVIGTISRQAVYDTLGVFVEKNLVRRLQPAGAAAWYEDRVSDNHHHLICRVCRAVIDIDCATGETPCLTAEDDHGYRVDKAEVVYWGLCPACQHTSVVDSTMDTPSSTAPQTGETATGASPSSTTSTVTTATTTDSTEDMATETKEQQ